MSGLFDEKKSLTIAELAPTQGVVDILSASARGLGRLALRVLGSIVDPLGYGSDVEMRKRLENDGYLVDVEPGISLEA